MGVHTPAPLPSCAHSQTDLPGEGAAQMGNGVTRGSGLPSVLNMEESSQPGDLMLPKEAVAPVLASPRRLGLLEPLEEGQTLQTMLLLGKSWGFSDYPHTL